MLQNEDVVWIKNQRMLHEKFPRRNMSGQERARWFRIRKRLLETLETLTVAVEEMPEQQRNQVITSDSLRPFIDAILESWEPEEKVSLVKNKRILKIHEMLIHKLSSIGTDFLDSKLRAALRLRVRNDLDMVVIAAEFLKLSQGGTFRRG